MTEELIDVAWKLSALRAQVEHQNYVMDRLRLEAAGLNVDGLTIPELEDRIESLREDREQETARANRLHDAIVAWAHGLDPDRADAADMALVALVDPEA